MSCEEIRDLLPAYALGLLDSDEAVLVEEHLAGCREHAAELVDLRATSLALDALREDIEPSTGLRERIRGIPATARSVASPRWWMPAAAVLALLAVFGAGWFANEYFEDADSSPSAVELRYTHTLEGVDGELVRFSGTEGGDEVTVIMSNLERLDGGQLYRLWAIRDGEWMQIGQCNTDEEGGWVGNFAFALSPTDELAVTVESPAADPQPRPEPILRSRGSG